MDCIRLLLLFISIALTISTDRTIRRLEYDFEGNITSFEGGGGIKFQIEFTPFDRNTSMIQIETEQWIHERMLNIDRPPNLRIYFKRLKHYFPRINAYLRLHTYPSRIVLNESAKLFTTNPIYTRTLSLELSGNSIAHVAVEVASKLYARVSDSAQLSIRGFVAGTGFISVSGKGEVNAQRCLMDEVFVNASSASKINVAAALRTRFSASGFGRIHYEQVNPKNSFFYYPFFSTASKQSHISIQLCFLVITFLV